MVKYCRLCELEKPLSEFYRNRKVCSACKKKQSREYHAKNRGKIAAKDKERRATNRELLRERKKEYVRRRPHVPKAARKRYRETIKGRAHLLFRNAAARSVDLGLETPTIDREWIAKRLERGVCEATGLTLTMSAGHGKKISRAPSIERIDCKNGYTTENCLVVCWHYNTAKNHFSIDEFITLCRAVVDREAEIRRLNVG